MIKFRSVKNKLMFWLFVSTFCPVVGITYLNYIQFSNTLLVGLIFVAIGTGFAAVLANSISKPIFEIADAAKVAASGDLTKRVELSSEHKDEIGELAKALNLMIDSRRVTINEVKAKAEEFASATEQILANIEEINGQSQNQAANVHAIASAMLEVNTVSQQVASSSENLATFSEQTVSKANSGGEVVSKSINEMKVINTKVEALGNKLKSINNFNNLINEIADQTNLLALNASIEAARAGEHGKGFAVVADEVKKLADKSKLAVKDISIVIQEIDQDREATMAVVKEGVFYSSQADQSLKEIIKIIEETSNMIHDIAAASEEQSASSDQVLNSVESIATSTEETMAGIQETTSTVQELNERAQSLAKLMSKFKTQE